MNIKICVAMLLIISGPFVDRFMEGGPFFMSLILICLLLAAFFIIKGGLALKTEPLKVKKYLRLVSDVSLLGLVLGFLGSIIGMVQAFDAIEGFNQELNSAMIAGGLKVSFLTAIFGSFVFIVSRIGILILRSLQKAGHVE